MKTRSYVLKLLIAAGCSLFFMGSSCPQTPPPPAALAAGCTANIAGCAECPDGVCSLCRGGYVLNEVLHVCEQGSCLVGCSACSKSGEILKCTACDAGYNLTTGICVPAVGPAPTAPCGHYCVAGACNSVTKICAACSPGWAPDAHGVCVASNSNSY